MPKQKLSVDEVVAQALAEPTVRQHAATLRRERGAKIVDRVKHLLPNVPDATDIPDVTGDFAAFRRQMNEKRGTVSEDPPITTAEHVVRIKDVSPEPERPPVFLQEFFVAHTESGIAALLPTAPRKPTTDDPVSLALMQRWGCADRDCWIEIVADGDGRNTVKHDDGVNPLQLDLDTVVDLRHPHTMKKLETFIAFCHGAV